jgi:putative ABC transport system permease protein
VLGHYLRTIARNLLRSKLVTLLNIAGLGVGLACFILSFVLIEQLSTSDGHFRNSARTYVLTQQLWMGNSAKPVTAALPITTAAAAPFLKTDFPQAEAVARAVGSGFVESRVAVSAGDRSLFLHPIWVDPDFLKIFDLPFVDGDRSSPLASADGVIITEAAARRLFGTANAVGRRFLENNQSWATVKAVIASVPQPSHMGDDDRSLLRFDVIGRLTPQVLQFSNGDDWANPVAVTYVLLPPRGAFTAEALRAGLRTFADRHMPRAVGHAVFDAVPLSHVGLKYLDTQFGANGLSVTSSLLLADVLMLAVACFNYASLATAVALRRGREVALHKVVGAQLWQIVLQSLCDAAGVALLALLLALLIVIAAVPLLRSWLQIELELEQLGRTDFWVFLAALVPLTTLLAGAYPALILSRLSAARMLRSDMAATGPRWAFRSLAAVQFAAAGFLIVLVLVVRDQNRHMGEALPALLRNPTIVVTTDLGGKRIDPRTLNTELAKSPYIRGVSDASQVPWDSACCWVFNVTHSPDTAARQVQASASEVGFDYFETMGIKRVAGRVFSRGFGDEFDDNHPFTGRTFNIVIDRKLAAKLGWSNSQEAVGRMLYRPALWGGVTSPLRVVGVVENDSARLAVKTGLDGNLYLLSPSAAGYPIIRIDPHHVREAIAHLERTWRAIAPTLPLEWRFMDELFDRAYATYSNISAVATGLTAFAFAIALMGLAGMAIHVTTGRLREVGVRKTLGAKPRQILELLLLDFAKPIVIANVLAWPFAWFAARAYLSMFLSRISLTPLPFVASLVATVAIVCVAVGGQALRAARVEPAEVLRYQ